MANKILYWLKLHKDFFSQKHIKKLRKMAGGDTYTIIYLKMQLLSLQTQGDLYFDGVEETFEKELALELDENEDDVQMTMLYLKAQGLIEIIADNEFSLSEVKENILSENGSTARVRRHRAKQKALQCNANETQCNKNETIDKDKDIDKDIDKDKELNNPPLSPLVPSGEKQKIELPPKVEEAFSEWLTYKKEKRQGYKPTGERNLRQQVKNKLNTLSEEQVIEAIRLSMAANYQGIIWELVLKQRRTEEEQPIDFAEFARRLEERGE